MTPTAQLGTSQSELGSIVLGAAPSSAIIARSRPMPTLIGGGTRTTTITGGTRTTSVT